MFVPTVCCVKFNSVEFHNAEIYATCEIAFALFAATGFLTLAIAEMQDSLKHRLSTVHSHIILLLLCLYQNHKRVSYPLHRAFGINNIIL